MAQLALGQNLVIRWRHLHCSQSWPPGRVTCIATLPVSIELVSARITSVKSAKPLGFTHSVRETRTHRSNQGYQKKWKWCLKCEEKSSYWYVRDGMEVVEVEKVRGMFLFLFFNSGNILHKSIQHKKISTWVFQEVFLDHLEQSVDEGDRETTSTFFEDGIRKVSGIGKHVCIGTWKKKTTCRLLFQMNLRIPSTHPNSHPPFSTFTFVFLWGMESDGFFDWSISIFVPNKHGVYSCISLLGGLCSGVARKRSKHPRCQWSKW